MLLAEVKGLYAHMSIFGIKRPFLKRILSCFSSCGFHAYHVVLEINFCHLRSPSLSFTLTK